jgi:hypothetical protein
MGTIDLNFKEMKETCESLSGEFALESFTEMPEDRPCDDDDDDDDHCESVFKIAFILSSNFLLSNYTIWQPTMRNASKVPYHVHQH